MSDFDVVLERLLVEPGFVAALAADPDRALVGYRLTADEVSLLRTQVGGDAGGQRGVETRANQSSLFGLLGPLAGLAGGSHPQGAAGGGAPGPVEGFGAAEPRQGFGPRDDTQGFGPAPGVVTGGRADGPSAIGDELARALDSAAGRASDDSGLTGAVRSAEPPPDGWMDRSSRIDPPAGRPG